MISNNALRNLRVSKDRKEKIEMYFDILEILKAAQSLGLGGIPSIPAYSTQIDKTADDVN